MSVTVGARNVAPATLWFALSAMARNPSPNAASTVVSPANRIVPPFSVSAPAPMLSPSVSASPCTTVYRNVSARPVPAA